MCVLSSGTLNGWQVGSCHAHRGFVHAQLCGRQARLLAAQGHVWGPAKMTALADMIQAALMLKYNERVVG